MSETKFPYYHGIVLLQLSEVDIGCNNGNIGHYNNYSNALTLPEVGLDWYVYLAEVVLI